MVHITSRKLLLQRSADSHSRVDERHGEKGVVLVAASFLMVFLLIVAAFAVDLGNVRQRQVDLQAVVDLAALAGAQDLPSGRDATVAALDSVQLNLGINRSAWNGCHDPDALVNVVVLPDINGSNCISFNQEFTLIRVTLPEQLVTTYFGGVIGIEEFGLTTSAEAAAIVARSNRIIPATVSANVDPGQRCVETSGANTGCPTHVDGFFGSILSPRLYQFIPSTGNYDGEAQALNFALNLDHDIIPYDLSDPATCDGAIWSPCSSSNINNSGLRANHLIISTGNSVPPVTEGLVTGGVAATSDFGDVTFCGRLTRPDFNAVNALDPLPDNCQSPGEPTIDHIGYTINGRHLYHWMTPAARNMFYPEVSVDPITGLAPVLTDPVYAAGDARLQCFLTSYRMDVSTGQETVPDCTHTGLFLPDNRTLVYQSSWNAGYTSYTDPGSPALGGPWTEPTGDRGETQGNFQLDPGVQHLFINKRVSITDSIWREVSLPAGTDAIVVHGHLFLDSSNHFALEYSFDNATWDTLADVTTGGLIEHSVQIDTGGASSIFLRYRRVSDASSFGTFQSSSLVIDFYQYQTAPGTRMVDPIFEPEMVQDTRFAAIPIILDWPASGTKASPVTGFWYAFIYKLYGNNTKVQAFDVWVFDPALAGHDRDTAFAGYGFDLNAFIRLER